MDPIDIRDQVREVLDAAGLTPNSIMGAAVLMACLRTKAAPDIKSRPMYGYCAIDGACCFRHCWAEASADGHNWNVIDATRPEISGTPEGLDVAVTYIREDEQEEAGVRQMMRVDLQDDESRDNAARFEGGVRVLVEPDGWRALIEAATPTWRDALETCLKNTDG